MIISINMHNLLLVANTLSLVVSIDIHGLTIDAKECVFLSSVDAPNFLRDTILHAFLLLIPCVDK